ncbi:MAG: hypothetical protein ACR2QV_10020 [Gammaproteobacteria bacterium]
MKQTTKTTTSQRILRAAQFSVLAVQIIGLGIAAVYADDTASLAAVNMDPVTTCATEYRDEVRASAAAAVDTALVDTKIELGLKMAEKDSANTKVAAKSTDKRG